MPKFLIKTMLNKNMLNKNMLNKNMLKALVAQGDHKERIEEHLATFVEIFRDAFPEDNRETQDNYLRARLEAALKSIP